MELLLFLLVFLLFVFTFMLKRTIIHPLVILKLYCSLSTFVLIFYSVKWGHHISIETLLIFVFGLICVDFGYFVGDKLFRKRNLFQKNPKSLPFSSSKALFVSFLLLILLFLFLRVIMNQISFDTNVKEFSKSLIIYKNARKTSEAEDLGILQYLITASTIIAVVYLYAIIKDFYETGLNKRIFIFCLPIIVVFMFFYLTARRSLPFTLIIIALVLIYEYNKRKKRNFSMKWKIRYVLSSILLFGGFYFYFIYFGKLFLKNVNDIFNTFAIYLSGGIISFDIAFEQYKLSSDIFGQNMLRLFYKILNIIPGINFPTETINTTIRTSNEFATNVYTVNLHYMADFGYMGVLVGNLIIGLFFSFIFNKSKSENQIGFWSVLYAFFVTKLLSYTGAEKFFVSSTLNVQYILFLFLFMKSGLLLKKNN